MRSTQQAIRRCIDDLADDLIELADELIRDHVERALSRITPPPPPASRSRAPRAEKAEASAPKGRRKLTPLEKLERAQARKKARQQLALPFAGAADHAAAEPKPSAGRRRRKAEAGRETAPPEKPAPAPPPLFVVKRTRDGHIQTLQRKAEEEAAAAAAAAASPENAAPPAE